MVPLCLLAAACSSDGGADAIEWRETSNSPRQFEPSQSGYVIIAPQGARVAVGKTVAFAAFVVGLDGSVTPAASATFSSATPEVLGVTNHGVVSGVKAGVGEVLVRSARIGEHRTFVIVSDGPPADVGPVSAGFSPRILVLQPGETASYQTTYRDVNNQTLAPPPMVHESSDSAVVEVTRNGVVSALAPGVGAIVAKVGTSGRVMVGELPVIVVDKPAAGGDGGPGGVEFCPDHIDQVLDCGFAMAPWRYVGAGVSSELRLWVVREVAKQCAWSYTYEAPSKVELAVRGVVDINSDGLLESLAPGFVEMRAVVDGYVCRPTKVFVLPDLRGPWRVECSDTGDKGAIDGVGVKPHVLHAWGDFGRSPSLSQVPVVQPSYHSCMDEGSGPGCSEDYKAYLNLLTAGCGEIISGEPAGRLCSDKAPCCGVSFGHCSKRNASKSPLTVRGPDRLRLGKCVYTRGEGTCGGSSGGQCDLIDKFCTDGRACRPARSGEPISYNTGTCGPRPTAGEPCVTGTCAGGLYCRVSAGRCSGRDQAGVCTELESAGTKCYEGCACASGSCLGLKCT